MGKTQISISLLVKRYFEFTVFIR